MPDFLTRRNGSWHFVRRVPAEFAELDPRGVIKHSTKIRISHDRTGRRAARVAEKLNQQLEQYWKGLSNGKGARDRSPYEAARRRARALGFDYFEADEVATLLPTEKIVERVEAFAINGNAPGDGSTAAAVLGAEKRPAFKLSKLFQEYEAVTRDEVMDLSADQLRIWRNGRIRAVERFVGVVGDKLVTEVNHDDGIAYVEWWRDRVVNDEVEPKTANKDIGQLSRMLKDVSTRRRLNIPNIFKDLRLRGEKEKPRLPFENEFIQEKLLAEGALAGLNEDARLVLYIIVETGMRPSEIVNLRESAIRLDTKVPHVKIIADGRRLKTDESAREIPLVGVALKALKMRPKGFPRYRDKSSGLSGTLNKFLLENDLRPSKDHKVYSLRHSFKDRLVAAEAPDSLIDSLMGHKTHKPKYGRGPSLELKLKFLEQIAFTSPVRL